jgi:hypothetical protein
MSTYLQGVTDTGFNPLSYTPNFPYMQQALEKAQAKYDTNYNQVANAYHKIADQKLLNPENEIYRKQFLEKTKEELKQISTKDFSNQSNVDEAEKILSPFWEDNDLLADYKITKEYQKQRQSYETLNNSDKKEDRDRAWEEGLNYVNLTAQDMALAKRGDGSIQKVQVRPYIPYVNVSSEINKELDARGYKDGIIKSPYIKDGYIYKVTNGQGTKEIYATVLSKILQERPDLREIFKVQGTVKFQSAVNQIRAANPNLSYDEAVKNTKDLYAKNKIEFYNFQIKKNNTVLKGDDNVKGLEAEIKEEEDAVVHDMSLGIITKTDERVTKLKIKHKQLLDIKNIINSNQNAIIDLKSGDFFNSKGEDYFSKHTEDEFVDGYALTRELAYKEEISVDQTYVASMRLNEDWRKTEEKYNQDRNLDINGNGVIDQGDAILGQANKTTATKIGAASTAANNRTDLKEIGVNIPIVEEVYGKSTALETSYYDNLKANHDKYGEGFISSTTALIQSSPYLNQEVPKLSDLVEYYQYLATGKKDANKYFDEKGLQETFKSLKDKKILGDKFDKYNTAPVLALNELVKYSENLYKQNSNGTLSPELVDNHMKYEDYSKKYLTTRKILSEFDEFYKKSGNNALPQFKSIVVKDNKNNNYRLVNESDIKNTPLLEYSTTYGIPPKKINSKLSDDLIKNYLNGSLQLDSESINQKTEYHDEHESAFVKVGYKYSVLDPKTKVRYDVTELVNKYGSPEQLASTINNYNITKSKNLPNYIASNSSQFGNDISANEFIFSKGLKYKNTTDNIDDKADQLAQIVISENKGNVTKGGSLKPINYDQLTENATTDNINKILDLIFNNSDKRNDVLSSVTINYSGKKQNAAVAKLTIDTQKLTSLFDKGSPAEKIGMANAIRSIETFGIEFDMTRNSFDLYAKDNYMSSVVSESMLKTGLKSSPWEEDNLHYKYNIQSGSNNTIILNISTKEYNPTTKQFTWGSQISKTFPKNLGLDAILGIVKEGTQANTDAINTYIYKINQKKDYKNNPDVKKPDETMDQYKERINIYKD